MDDLIQLTCPDGNPIVGMYAVVPTTATVTGFRVEDHALAPVYGGETTVDWSLRLVTPPLVVCEAGDVHALGDCA